MNNRRREGLKKYQDVHFKLFLFNYFDDTPLKIYHFPLKIGTFIYINMQTLLRPTFRGLNLCGLRSFSSVKVLLNKNINLEKELNKLADITASIEQKKIPKVPQDLVDEAHLLSELKNFHPKVMTEHAEIPGLKRPLPLSAELNYYAPFKNKVEYGDLKAEVIFKCYDPRNLEFFCNFALRVAYYLGIPATGPKPLPVRRERWTVIRAPFVHAKSKENFERRTYTRMLRLWDANERVVDTFLAYIKENSVWGVGVKVNMYVQEALKPSKQSQEQPGGESRETNGISGALDALSNSNPIASKVLDLLQDPAFTRHMSPEELSEVKHMAAKPEDKN